MSTALEHDPDSAGTEPGRRSDAVRRRELGAFLRSRRERITPRQVGLPRTGRRRTPGLRREEVAQLAGVGVTWYTWLEQGRDIRASEQVLRSIARTLQLDPYESAHLLTLAGYPARPAERDCRAIGPGAHAMLRYLQPCPVVVQNARADILAYNRSYDWLLGGIDAIPFEDRNTLLQCFVSRRWYARLLDGEQDRARSVARFRAAMADNIGDPNWRSLLDRLLAESPDFAGLWNQHAVEPPMNWTKRFRHPDAGVLSFHTTYLWLNQRPEIVMTTYTPADDETATKLPAPTDQNPV